MCLTEFNQEVFVKGIRKEGFEDGKIDGKTESILELLEDYGEIPELLRNLIIEQTDMKLLSKWLKIAARVETIEEFEEKIGFVKEH